VVHSLFKDYHTCARSFSLLSPLALPSLSRLVRKRPKTPPQPPLKALLRMLLQPLRMLLQPLRMPLQPQPTPPLAPLRVLLTLSALLRTLLRLLPVPLRTLLLPLATLPRRCNLRLWRITFYRIGRVRETLRALFFWRFALGKSRHPPAPEPEQAGLIAVAGNSSQRVAVRRRPEVSIR
jgi:hypothetical protein